MSSIDPAVPASREEFAAAQPFRHVVIAGTFLERSLCERLSADFPSFEDRHALNEMGAVGGKAVRMDVREISDSYRELTAICRPGDPGLRLARDRHPDLLYNRVSVAARTTTAGLDAHCDVFNYHPRTRWHGR